MKPLKPNIFVSSTVFDLPNEREAAKRAIEKIPANPVMSEYSMNAVDKPSAQTCVDEVKKADFYILILGGRYGWELENGVSITELEYDTAYKEGKPIFVFNTNYKKEEKQQAFAIKAGSQRFWKTVNNAFELEESIINSYNQFIEENYYEKRNSKENLYSNLLQIEFPKRIYMAELDIERDEIIKSSWETDFKLKKNAAQPKVVLSAIYQMGLVPTSDWVLFEKKLITFHDLNNSINPLSNVIDKGTITSLECEEFYGISSDYLNVFKKLLRYCLNRKLHHMGIKSKGKIYAYIPDEEFFDKRTISWHGKKDATRTVFELKRQKKNPDKVSYGKHFAFKATFHLIDESWYMSILPDWFISYDGYHESFFGYQQLSYLKRNERNAHVHNHLKFVVHELTKVEQTSLFKETFKYLFLKFKELEKVEAFPKVDENNWFNHESSQIQNLLIDNDKSNLTLFDV